MVQHCRGSSGVRGRSEGGRPPSAARGPSLASALAQFLLGDKHLHVYYVARQLVVIAPDTYPANLTPHHIAILNAWLGKQENGTTRHRRAGACRRVLRHLEENYGAPKLGQLVIRPPQPKPRNVTATEEERSRLLSAAKPNLRCWLLLCSDLAIRAGTAAKLGPANYDRLAGTLTFRTKYQNAQRLPVTAELRALLDTCTDPNLPFVAQLDRGLHVGAGKPKVAHAIGRMKLVSLQGAYIRLRRALGITRAIRAHDLRRTTARQVYDHTRDLRLVQALLGHSDLNSTLWYLQADTTEVPVSTLELAKLNPLTERPQ